MNKLKQAHLTRTPWGSVITWVLTNKYMAKTIEIAPNKQTSLLVHEYKEKSIIVIEGELRLTHGKCCDEKDIVLYKLPEGWTWHIDSGEAYRYAAGNKPVKLIEISNSQLEGAIIIKDENDLPPKIDIKKEIRKGDK